MSEAAQPTVSVVIPMHNARDFLAAAVSSALRQTHTPLEVIVVDDGSTDDSVAVASALGPGVTVVRSDWRGVSAARNLGIERARGELIALLDADDEWERTKLERQVARRAATRAALVLTGYELVADGRLMGIIRPSTRHDAIRRWLTLDADGPAFASTALIDRAVLREVGGFDESLSTSADAALAWKIARSHRIDVVPDALVRYRVHANQMHRDPELVRSDVAHMLRTLQDDPMVDPSLLRRGRANVEVALAFRYLARRQITRALRHLIAASMIRPDRVVVAPVQGAWRRLRREGLLPMHRRRW